jgi:hypothetical protein
VWRRPTHRFSGGSHRLHAYVRALHAVQLWRRLHLRSVFAPVLTRAKPHFCLNLMTMGGNAINGVRHTKCLDTRSGLPPDTIGSDNRFEFSSAFRIGHRWLRDRQERSMWHGEPQAGQDRHARPSLARTALSEPALSRYLPVIVLVWRSESIPPPDSGSESRRPFCISRSPTHSGILAKTPCCHVAARTRL